MVCWAATVTSSLKVAASSTVRAPSMVVVTPVFATLTAVAVLVPTFRVPAALTSTDDATCKLPAAVTAARTVLSSEARNCNKSTV